MKKRLAFDMSSWSWTMLSGGKDAENGYTVVHEEKEVFINSAVYGYDRVMARMVELVKKMKLNPINCILVFEGANSKSRRLLIDPSYKGGGAGSRPPQAYEEFHKLRDMLKQTWKDLGAIALTQDAAEGDDTLAWLAQHTEDDLMIATFDNDLTVLNMVNEYGATVTTWINEMVGFNKYGVFDYDLVTTYKALVGDSSDNIKGCAGFGPGAWEKLRVQYGDDGVREIHNLLQGSQLAKLEDFIGGPEDKLLTKIFEQAPQVQRCFDLAKIRPEWVNTMRKPLTWEPGMVRLATNEDRDPTIRPWLAKRRLVTGDTFADAVKWAMPHILASEEVSLDIETSTPDESDEWLANMTKSGDAEDAGVDVFGSYLCGLGLTFGPNNQYTLYFSVKHADTDNIDSELLRQFIAAIPRKIPLIIQNVSFELAVLFNEWGDRQLDNGYHGFLPNVLDTALEASYVDENSRRGLKERSHSLLGYRQQTFDEVTRLTGAPGELFPGGRLLHTEYLYEDVGTGKFEPLTDEEREAGVVPMEITKKQLVERPTGRTVINEETGEEEPELEPVVKAETRRYKMHELPAWHVLGYGADDPQCTIALHNFYKLHMQLEHHYEVYKQVEISAAYQHAKNFIDGCDISLEKMNELAKEDDAVYEKSWAVLREFLMDSGWDGTRPPNYTVDITPAEVKEAYTIVTGKKLETAMRTMSKLVTFIREVAEEPQFAGMLQLLVDAKAESSLAVTAERAFNNYVRMYFKGEPQFNDGSPKQMQRLLYEVMGLPIVVRNKATETMRAAGIKEGTPKTDNLAINYASAGLLKQVKEVEAELAMTAEGDPAKQTLEAARDRAQRLKCVLDALQLMSMVGTRRSLYYAKYPYFPHWKDGKIRSQHNQAAANTRRATESKPNKQQLPKHAKIEGHASRFREVVVPHRPDAVIVSIDFKAQELRVIADYSQDPNMLSCYVGDDLRDQHSLVGLGIAQRDPKYANLDYATFEAIRADEKHPDHKEIKAYRTLGKKVGFTTEYGAMAPKLALTIMSSEAEAQEYIDAKEATFAVAAEWKIKVIEEARAVGQVRTKLGAVRHLGPAFMSDDKWEASKAERQAVNFKIQGSSAEMTKLAEGAMWEADLAYRFDAVCIGPIHDEVVWSVALEDLFEFIPEMHACMVRPYADMKVPIEGDISFGPNLYKQIEIGAVPSRAAIEKGLAKMQVSG